MSLFVKICGLSRGEDVDAAAALRPDALGFVFWSRSPRAVLPEDVAAWTRGLPGGIERVGVFVDAPPEEVRRAAEVAGLTIVQLHGHEGPEACRDAWPRVWKAFPLSRGPADALAPYPVEAFVIDSGTTTRPGGTGQTADWGAAAEFVAASPRPVLLAGGLTPENVAQAVNRVRPWGVDVASGVESAPGRKDAARMREFVNRCRES